MTYDICIPSKFHKQWSRICHAPGPQDRSVDLKLLNPSADPAEIPIITFSDQKQTPTLNIITLESPGTSPLTP